MRDGRQPSTPAPTCACGCGRLIENWRWGKWVRCINGHAPNRKGRWTGAKNSRWKGGITRMRHGYVLVQAPSEHPRTDHRGYVKRSVLVLESKLGRFLRSDEHAHHVNHVTDDDRPENLEVMTASAHSMLHRPDRLKALRDRNLFPKGSDNGNAKLSQADIPKVFEMRQSGMTQQAIADHFGVVQQLISNVLLRKNWKHVQPQAASTAT